MYQLIYGEKETIYKRGRWRKGDLEVMVRALNKEVERRAIYYLVYTSIGTLLYSGSGSC